MDRTRVGERDGWCCGICQNPIDPTLRAPHPKSQSLDHVIPLAEGGPHTYANTRISHLRCNVLRQHRGGGEQLALIG
ncbi:HNH endonuclease [Verrucosispora sp. NA02020]|uniref:HNH endonuclease n=1 Tax=Verrucosispora sp. NA02020 TaxID=2742132 RepID=UPI003D7199A0